MGDRAGNCRRAIQAIVSRKDNELLRCSSFYLTEPVGVRDQDWFVNGVIAVETRLTPRELLEFLLAIETDMGRERKGRWGPRVIDLDILLYDAQVVEEQDLKIPHPGIQDRGFVLTPLGEIAPDLTHPVLGKKVSQMLAELKGGERVLPLPQEGQKICPV